PVDVQVQEKALEVTKVLIQTCYPEQSSLEGIGLRILRNCLEILNEPTTTRGQAAIKVIVTFISCSVLDALVPQMTNSYDKEPSTRQGVLTVFAAVLDAMIQVKPSSGTPDHSISPLRSFKDDLLSRFISGLESGSTAEANLLCLHRLVQATILSGEELIYIAQNLTNALLNAPMAEDDLTIEILALLQHISTLSPKTLEDTTLPSLFALLPDQAPSKDRDDEEYVRCVHALTCLGSLCIQADLFSILVVRLFTKVELLMGVEYQDQRTTEAAIGYIHALLKTLYSAVLTKHNASDPDLPKYIERFIPREGELKRLYSRQEVWAQSAFDAFFNGKFDLIAFEHSSRTGHSGYEPLQTSPTKSTSFLAPLFAAALIGLRVEVANISELLDKLINGAVLSEDSKEREALTNLAQALVACNHPTGVKLASQLLVLFNEKNLSGHASRALGSIPNLGDSVLNHKYHAIIRDFQTEIIPKETFSSAITEALVAIIEAKGETQGLAVLSSHLGSLVPVILRNTSTQGSSQSYLRLKSSALRLLAGIPDKMKQEDIQPYKSRVLRELQTALDDGSKGVRRNAVIAR
ncbi:16868_t:CDS:10, partial [Acaulospora colombiana]